MDLITVPSLYLWIKTFMDFLPFSILSFGHPSEAKSLRPEADWEFLDRLSDWSSMTRGPDHGISVISEPHQKENRLWLPITLDSLS
jgi:hypothetical protein